MFDAGVYLARFPGRPKRGLAVRPRLVTDGRVVTWHDTTRHRRFRATVESSADGSLAILVEDGRRIDLEPLTVESFAAEFSGRVSDVPSFDNDAALREFYLERF